MKKLLILLLLFWGSNVLGQPGAGDATVIRAFIPGERDSLINGLPAKIIDPRLLANGFELKLSDTSFKILSYFVTFDLPDGSLNQIHSKESRIEPGDNGCIELRIIANAETITVENIAVEKKNDRRRRLVSLIYFKAGQK